MQYLDKMSSCLYGYTEQFAGAEKARVENHLTIQKKGGVSYKGCRHNGETYSYTEYIRQMLKEGTKPEEYVNGKRTAYKLVYPDGSYIDINKSQFGFANFLIENGYVDDKKALKAQKIIAEKQRKKEADEKAMRENAEKKQHEWLERKEKYEHKVGIYDSYTEKNYPKAVDVANTIASKEGFLYNAHNLRVLTLLTHPELIDDPSTMQFYKEELAELLNKHNHISRKLFTLYSGIDIGTSIENAVQTWLGNPIVMIPQKKAVESKGRTALQRAIDSIIADNGCDERLPGGAFIRDDGKFIIFNSFRDFHLNEKVDGIHMVNGDQFKQEKGLFDRLVSSGGKRVEIPHTYKEMSDWRRNNKNRYYNLKNAYTTVNGTEISRYINAKYLEEAMRILGVDVEAYACKDSMAIYFTSAKGEGIVLCVRSDDGIIRD